jgi:hypothetical protein
MPISAPLICSRTGRLSSPTATRGVGTPAARWAQPPARARLVVVAPEAPREAAHARARVHTQRRVPRRRPLRAGARPAPRERRPRPGSPRRRCRRRRRAPRSGAAPLLRDRLPRRACRRARPVGERDRDRARGGADRLSCEARSDVSMRAMNCAASQGRASSDSATSSRRVRIPRRGTAASEPQVGGERAEGLRLALRVELARFHASANVTEPQPHTHAAPMAARPTACLGSSSGPYGS